jgi:hypothetical protein
MTKQQAELIRAEIATLAETRFLTATNEGTFGADEACRKVGSGDPAFATRRVYLTPAGQEHVTGPDEGRAPGRMRRMDCSPLAAARARLAALRSDLARTAVGK